MTGYRLHSLTRLTFDTSRDHVLSITHLEVDEDCKSISQRRLGDRQRQFWSARGTEPIDAVGSLRLEIGPVSTPTPARTIPDRSLTRDRSARKE